MDVEGDSGNSLSNYYYNAWNGFQSTFNSEEESTILNTNTDELISYYLQKYLLSTLEIDSSRRNIMEKEKARFSGEVSIKISVPLIPKERIEDVVKQSASSRLVGFSFRLENDYLVTEIHSSRNVSEDDIKQALNHLNTTIDHKNSSVRSGNQDLKTKIEKYIPQVKARLEKENQNIESLADKLPVDLVKKTDAGKTVDLPKKEKIELIKPKPEPSISSTEESSKAKWDVFISYASEDREAIARPFAKKLKSLGLEVWFDEFNLKWGSSLRKSIDEGLANSLFGVVILSKIFFKKEWTQMELDGLVSIMTTTSKDHILPLRYELSHDELTKVSPTLAGIFSRSWDEGIDKLANEVKGLVEERKSK